MLAFGALPQLQSAVEIHGRKSGGDHLLQHRCDRERWQHRRLGRQFHQLSSVIPPGQVLGADPIRGFALSCGADGNSSCEAE
jgi:hypothetical protein